MELVIQEVDLIMSWAYKVPGFRELDRDDQASLVSSGKVDRSCSLTPTNRRPSWIFSEIFNFGQTYLISNIIF